MNSIAKRYAAKFEGVIPKDALEDLTSGFEDVLSSQLAILPMACKGPTCPMAKKCPLQQKGIAPVGESCPIEQMIIEHTTEQLRQSLSIDPQNHVELTMLADMVEMIVLNNRTSNDLSIGDYFDMQAVGVDSKGAPILRKEESVALQVKLKLQKRLDDLRRTFMATREIKAKYKQQDIKDSSQILAEIRKLNETKVKELPPPPALDITPEDVDIEAIPADWKPEDGI